MKQKVNKQSTRHGKMKMPFAMLNKFAGKKGGGKVKKFAEGGDVEIKDQDFSSIKAPELPASEPASFKEAFAAARKEKGAGGTFTWNGKKFTTNYASDKPKTEEVVVSASRLTPKNDKSPRVSAGPSDEKLAKVSRTLNAPRKTVRPEYQDAVDRAGRGFRGSATGASMKKFARGGGIEIRGKTRGKFI